MMTLIVATDFSPLAENAVAYAAGLAKQFQARLIIFNAFTLSVPASNALLSAADFEDMLLANQNRLKKRAEQIALSHGIVVGHESSYSIIPEELENLLAKYQAELIVLGMEPESLTQDIFGNTTTALIRRLNCPVLAVPGGAHFNGLRKILFACDVAHGMAADILPKVKAMALAFHAEVEVFFVEEKAGQHEAGATEFNNAALMAGELNDIAFSYKKIRSDAVISTIKREISAAGADLLIMVPKVYGFWSSAVHRSKTRRMASGLTIPLLAIPG